jgi:NADP-dependent 3-hydroxy acid dehydrogenase YdfG
MRVVVITGGSDGIGAEIARQLAGREGAGLALVLAARDQDKLDQVAGQCAALGAQALALRTDVADQDSAGAWSPPRWRASAASTS